MTGYGGKLCVGLFLGRMHISENMLIRFLAKKLYFGTWKWNMKLQQGHG